MRRTLAAFVAGLVLMAATGYWWLYNRQNASTETHYRGLGRKIETIAMGEVVDSIRSVNRLTVFQAYITSTTTTHDIGWFSRSDQTMLTPAYVNYYVDMEAVNSDRIRIKGNNVLVALPSIMIERPNIDTINVQTFNGGIWTNLAGTTDKLRVSNSKMALRQLFSRAKMPFLVKAAKKAAIAAVEANIRNVLAASGHADVKVHIVVP